MIISPPQQKKNIDNNGKVDIEVFVIKNSALIH